MMTRLFSWRSILASVLLAVLATPVFAEGPTSCSMEFKLEGWEAIYETASGTGTIKCSNGQKAKATLRSKGGGMAFGKVEILNGTGTFSEVADISEVFGDYTFAEAEAGAGKAADAQVLTKGYVSLALAGTGKGVEAGFTFGKFSITKEP